MKPHRRVSMQTIADRLGLSKYAVSRALSGKSGVSEETRRRVLAEARNLGYRLPRRTRPEDQAEPSHSGYILIWMDASIQQEGSYWGRILRGIAAACAEEGWQFAVVTPSLQGELLIPTYMERSSCIGHIALGKLPTEFMLSLHASGMPAVLVDHEEPAMEADEILNANIEGGMLLFRHLHAQGCRRIVFVGNELFASSFKERWIGCRLAAEELHSEEDPVRLRKWTIPYAQHRWTDELHLRLHAMTSEPLPDAFICANDDIALSLMGLLKARGFSIPEQVSVAGFDNIDAAAMSVPPLTTVDLAKEALGSRAVEQLSRRQTFPGARTEKILLAPRLIMRESVK